jgi:sugar phosphate isomerase/epimerase
MSKATRREALRAVGSFAAIAALPTAAQRRRVRVGMMDVLLGYASNPEAFGVGQKIGFDGIQVTLGKPVGPDRLVMSDTNLQHQILQASKDHGVAVASTYLDVMHRDCLQSNELAKTWVREGIRITKLLNGGIVELAFFFKCGLNSSADVDGLVRVLRELAPGAEREGIILGIENTLSAGNNIRLMDRVGSGAVKIWYDIGNATNMGHFDVPGEIRQLGRDRICQIHVKDKGYLGSGAVDVKGCLEAARDIGYIGWFVFETPAPTGDRLADAAKNLHIFRSIEAAI